MASSTPGIWHSPKGAAKGWLGGMGWAGMSWLGWVGLGCVGLVGWLAGWLVGWLAAWLVGWLAGWLVNCNWQVVWYIGSDT